MPDVTLKGFKVEDFTFHNSYEGGIRIELDHKYSYNVAYSKESSCRCELVCEVVGNHDSEKFSLKTTVIGYFAYNPALKKEQIHVMTFKELFPHVRAVVASNTATFGIAPIIIPAIDIETQNIIRFDMGAKGE